MNGNSTFRLGFFSLWMLSWSGVCHYSYSVAAENPPAVDPQIAELHIRLRGTKA